MFIAKAEVAAMQQVTTSAKDCGRICDGAHATRQHPGMHEEVLYPTAEIRKLRASDLLSTHIQDGNTLNTKP